MCIAILTCNNPVNQIKSRIYPLIPTNIESEVSIYTFDSNKTTTSDSIRLRFKVLMQTQTIYYAVVSDAKVFKALTGKSKATAYYSTLVQCSLDPKVFIVYIPAASQIYYNPAGTIDIITRAFENVANHYLGLATETYAPITQMYATTEDSVKDYLQELLDKNCELTCDIEAFSLNHYNAGIGTIAFAWNKHEGTAMSIDYDGSKDTSPNLVKREYLRNFFDTFTSKLIFHNAGYDVTVLIYTLYMEHLEDTEGLLKGLEVFSRITEDSQIITYLAVNSTARNSLKLKDLAQSFAGDYGIDEINDITKIPLDKLLAYNLTDAFSTWFVLEKYYPMVVEDNQLEVYTDLFRPALFDIIQMQLTGMPVLPERIHEVKLQLTTLSNQAMNAIQSNSVITDFTNTLKEEWVIKRNLELKKKRVTLDDADKVTFNPNSQKQLSKLLFEVLELPVLSLTDSQQPSTDTDTLKSLSNHTNIQEVKDFLSNLVDFKDVDKMLTTFIPILEKYQVGISGQAYIFGSLRLGGTVSGRLSSKGGLQQLPANSRFSKLIKSCFGLEGNDWLFTSLDFTSLEAKIGALLTRDPAKLDIYLHGYDSHCFNTYVYFPDKLPEYVTKLSQISTERNYYRITNDDGSVEYVTDLDPRIQEETHNGND